MFEDFEEPSGGSVADRRRRQTSAVVSLVLFAAIGTSVAAALAVGHQIVRRAEPEVEVHFEEMPAPDEPPPRREAPPPPRRTARPAPVQRQSMAAPTQIPDQVPEESDGELVAAGDVTPPEGSLDGVVGGTGNGAGGGEAEPPPDEQARLEAIPRYRHESIALPRRVGGCPRPSYPDELRRNGITDTVVVRVVVRADGTVGDVTFVRGDARFYEAVRACVSETVWEPAHLADGTAIVHARTLQFPFRLSNI